MIYFYIIVGQNYLLYFYQPLPFVSEKRAIFILGWGVCVQECRGFTTFPIREGSDRLRVVRAENTENEFQSSKIS